MRHINDIVYEEVQGTRLRLDLVLPSGVITTPRPAVIFVHGGGWIWGNKTTSCTTWLAGAGFVAISIDYRLTDSAPFPAQIHDVKSAIRWARAHAHAYGIDPDRIGVWGSSAGGHLSALCAVTNGMEWYEGTGSWRGFRSDVQCAVPICPPTDFLIDWYAVAGIPVHAEAEMCMTGLLGGPLHGREDLARAASPLWQVSGNAAPQLVIHGAIDDLVPVGQARAYVSALRQLGSHATYMEFPQEAHPMDAGIYLENADPYALREHITAFFRDHLKP